jgi:hypothetical protein
VHDSIVYLMTRLDRQRARFVFDVAAIGLDAGYATTGTARGPEVRNRQTDPIKTKPRRKSTGFVSSLAAREMFFCAFQIPHDLFVKEIILATITCHVNSHMISGGREREPRFAVHDRGVLLNRGADVLPGKRTRVHRHRHRIDNHRDDSAAGNSHRLLYVLDRPRGHRELPRKGRDHVSSERIVLVELVDELLRIHGKPSVSG